MSSTNGSLTFIESKSWIIAIVALIVLVLILAIIYIFTLPSNASLTEEPRAPTRIDRIQNLVFSNSGSSTNGVVGSTTAFYDQVSCTQSNTRVWKNNRCMCQPPFYGSLCNLESFNTNYIAMGNPDFSTLTLPQTEDVNAQALSFIYSKTDDTLPCTIQCDQNENCTGVIWNNGQCTLLLGNLISSENKIPYSTTTEATLYLNDVNALEFSDQVIIYSGNAPNRPWIVPKGSGYQVAKLQTMYRLDFIPTYQNNGTGQMGILSTTPFNPTDLGILLATPADNQIVLPGESSSISVPSTWVPPLYVAYA